MSALDAFIFIFIFESLMHWLKKICQFISLGFTNTHNMIQVFVSLFFIFYANVVYDFFF